MTQKDEHSELIVCDYCGGHLDVSGTEEKVLNKGTQRNLQFPLQLGDSFRYQGHRFEILSRLVFIEDGDYAEMSRQYLLYNPRRGTLWLDEYHGRYSISTNSHVMPRSDPFAKGRGDTLKTHDNREWIAEETGTYELAYVDGSLPWIARIGDKIAYAEFSAKNGSGEQYEVQCIDDEIEYGSGRALSLEVVRRATGKPDLGLDSVHSEHVDAAVKRKFYVSLMTAAVIALVINGILFLYCIGCGREVLREAFSADEINAEAMSQPFEVRGSNSLVKVTTSASPRLDNEWMALDVALVRDEETVVHVYDSDIEYYHGYEGGEHWSEGGQSEAAYIKVPEPGFYRLLLHAVSAKGNTNQSSKTTHGAIVRVVDGAKMPHFFIGAGIFSMIVLILTATAYVKWKQGDDDDDDDDDDFDDD